MKLEIEFLHASDWQRFKKIRLLSLLDSPDAFGSLYEEVASRPDSSWKDQISEMPTFVATIEGHDVGVVRLAVDKENATVCSLLSMWVAQNARGQGVGDRDPHLARNSY